MKILLLILATVLISSCMGEPLACTEEAKMCQDGTFVSRDSNNNCNFEECPVTIKCDYMNNCPESFNCYNFEDEPICYQGDPCLKCESLICDFTESFPMQVICEK
ncbi:hypothetical protein HN865_04310 [Candidatus Woesearchaeota archaeon]|nr:hypothetical protein [Candidatus Woesearchaeota archaeon]